MLRSLLLAVLLAAGASAQTATPIFDEDDAGSDGYYEASEGSRVGRATLELAGPDGRRLPVASGDAARGTDYGVLTLRPRRRGVVDRGRARRASPPLDLTEADSLVLFLNGPVGVPGVALPRLALQDADGDRTIGLSARLRHARRVRPERERVPERVATDLA